MKELYITRELPTEATIQAEIYKRLTSKGIKVSLEESFPLVGWKTMRAQRRGSIRVDVVVCFGKQVVCCIEVKNNFKPPAITPDSPVNQHRQFKKYMALGVPFRYCTSWQQIDDTVQWVEMRLRVHYEV